jgi:hypothetical protein
MTRTQREKLHVRFWRYNEVKREPPYFDGGYWTCSVECKNKFEALHRALDGMYESASHESREEVPSEGNCVECGREVYWGLYFTFQDGEKHYALCTPLCMNTFEVREKGQREKLEAQCMTHVKRFEDAGGMEHARKTAVKLAKEMRDGEKTE